MRRVQQIVQGHRVRADLGDAVHPHLFRHQMLLGQNGRARARLPADLSDGGKALGCAASAPEQPRQQEESGVYQHLLLEAVDDAYQQAVKRLELERAGAVNAVLTGIFRLVV